MQLPSRQGDTRGFIQPMPRGCQTKGKTGATLINGLSLLCRPSVAIKFLPLTMYNHHRSILQNLLEQMRVTKMQGRKDNNGVTMIERGGYVRIDFNNYARGFGLSRIHQIQATCPQPDCALLELVIHTLVGIAPTRFELYNLVYLQPVSRKPSARDI